jgi:hypothetical protein
MKKIVMATLLVAASAVAAQAKIFGFGVKAGINLPFQTELKVKDAAINGGNPVAVTPGHDLGFHAGLFGSITIPVIGVGIQPEVLYTNQKVAYVESHATANSGSFTYTSTKDGVSYLDIPINITWGLTLPKFHPFVAVTPYFRYSFKDVRTFTAAKIDLNTAEPESLKKSDYGIGFGLGFDLFDKLQILARYNIGLNKLAGDTRISFVTVGVGWYIF